MEELGLGPNGALIYCMEYLLENLDWLLNDELEQFGDDDYVLLDCPGQIELYTLVPVQRKLLLDAIAGWGYMGTMVSVFLHRRRVLYRRQQVHIRSSPITFRNDSSGTPASHVVDQMRLDSRGRNRSHSRARECLPTVQQRARAVFLGARSGGRPQHIPNRHSTLGTSLGATESSAPAHPFDLPTAGRLATD